MRRSFGIGIGEQAEITINGFSDKKFIVVKINAARTSEFNIEWQSLGPTSSIDLGLENNSGYINLPEDFTGKVTSELIIGNNNSCQ